MAHDGDQRLEQRQPARAQGLGEPRRGRSAGARAERGAERAGVERVEGVQAAAEPPHRAAERGDQGGVLAFDVAGDDGAHAEPDEPGEQAFGDGGLPDAGLALHPDAGVGDQPGAQPVGGVEPDGFGGVQVPADRDPADVAPDGVANGNSPQTWLVVPAKRCPASTCAGPAAAGDRPAPRRGGRASVVMRAAMAPSCAVSGAAVGEQVGGVDADAEGGGEPGGLGAAQAAQPELGLAGALFDVGDGGGQVVGGRGRWW